MGFFDNLLDFLEGDKKGPVKIIDGKIYVVCPNCGELVYIHEERCPKCKKRLDDMLRKKCPKCGTLNPLHAERCSKCGYDFAVEQAELEKLLEESQRQPVYVCPICGYRFNTYLTQCPACGTKFI